MQSKSSVNFKIVELPVKEAAKIGLEECLYVPCWSFRRYFSYLIHKEEPLSRIFLALVENHAVGIAVLDRDGYISGCETGVFVKEMFRRYGIGKALMKEVEKAKGGRLVYGQGVKGSDQFFFKSLGY